MPKALWLSSMHLDKIMARVYLEYLFIVKPLQPGVEIIIAELGDLGFESFVETESGVKAYIQKEAWKDGLLDDIQILSSEEFKIDFSFSELAQVNWNTEWEKNFDPIEVDGQCIVRAPFHPESDYKFEIVVEPKMSFGTGHHETTYMMLQYILENDFNGKTVLDMGCGTAVLAILAPQSHLEEEVFVIDAVGPYCPARAASIASFCLLTTG